MPVILTVSSSRQVDRHNGCSLSSGRDPGVIAERTLTSVDESMSGGAPELRPFRDEEAAELAAWLAGDTWPFHARTGWTVAEALDAIASGDFSGPNPTFWVEVARHGRIGIVHYRYLDDVSPDVDLRLLATFRGQGYGTRMAEWAAEHLFTTTAKHRLAGETRIDNIAMRRVFERCGWTREAHYRQSWPTGDGGWTDSIGYAILRDDWQAAAGQR
jgi:RimJ/RimL family protein N-acetyltransferase